MRAVYELPHLPHCTEEVLVPEVGPTPHAWAKWCNTCGALVLLRTAKDSTYVAQWVPAEMGEWVRGQLTRNREIHAQASDAGN